jgi:hypothetical protein
MFAPIFVAHSSHHGQLDSVATAFGLAALWVWTRPGTPRRALVAGLLLGVGGAVKTVPLLLVLALSPSARSWRERLQLAGAAGAVWLLAVLPFTLAAPEATREALSYRGVPGYGGLSLVLLKLGADDAFLYLYEHSQSLLLAPALLVATVVMHRRRAEPLTAALVVWLVVYVFGFNFFQHYLIWALPVLLALGRVPVAAVVAAATAAPLTTVYFSEDVPVWAIETFYTAPMIAVWLAAIYGLTRAARPAPARSGTAT